MIEPGVLLTAASMVVGSIVWLVRLEGKVKTNETLQAERYQRLSTQLADLDRKFEDLTDYLLRVNGDHRR